MTYVNTPAFSNRVAAMQADDQPVLLEGDLGRVRHYEIPAAGGVLQIVVDDGVDGFGSKFKSAVRSVSKAVSAPVKKVAAAAKKVVSVPIAMLGKAPAAGPGEEIQYVDENGKPLTPAQVKAYEAAAKQAEAAAKAQQTLAVQSGPNTLDPDAPTPEEIDRWRRGLGPVSPAAPASAEPFNFRAWIHGAGVYGDDSLDDFDGFFDKLKNAGKKVVRETKRVTKQVGTVAKAMAPGGAPIEEPLLEEPYYEPPAPQSNTALWVAGGVAAVAVTGLVLYLVARSRKGK